MNLPRRSRTHARNCAHRRSLLWFLACFVALQLGLAVAIELWLPALRDPLCIFKLIKLRRRIERAPTRPVTVVMVGSSRTAYGLRGLQLESQLQRAWSCPTVAFNLGVFGAGPVQELLYTRRMIAAGLKPDLLLIEVLPTCLAGQAEIIPEWRFLVPARLWPDEISWLGRYGLPVKQSRREWRQAWPVPWFSHRFEILSCVCPALVPLEYRQDLAIGADACGWTPAATVRLTEAQRRAASEFAQRWLVPSMTNFRLGGPSCQALRDLLQLCRQQRLPAALVLMPEGADLRKNYPPAAWRAIRSFVQELVQTYRVPLLDGRQWLADEDFVDGHHMLAQGATVFTRRLGRELLATFPRPWPNSPAPAASENQIAHAWQVVGGQEGPGR